MCCVTLSVILNNTHRYESTLNKKKKSQNFSNIYKM